MALQGDVREHTQVLAQLGAEVLEVKTPEQLQRVQALVIPGGESTTIYKLSQVFGMYEPIKKAIAEGLPTLGTCAGLILLAEEIIDGASGQKSFGGLNAKVRRNAFGSQNDSFETKIKVAGVDGLVSAAFIRAPLIETLGEGVQIIAKLPGGQIVGVRQANVIGISFHPELTGDSSVHKLLLDMI